MVFFITEAKYVTIQTTALENIWIKGIAGELGLFAGGIIQLSGANHKYFEIAQEAHLIEASKHIEIYYHFISQ